MNIMPVSGLNSGHKASHYMSYTGINRELSDGNTEGSPINNEVKKANKLVKVPVVVMMAMSPAMLNSATPYDNDMLANGEKTVMIAALPSSEADSDVPNLMAYAAPAQVEPPQRTTKTYTPNLAWFRHEKPLNIKSFINHKGEKKYLIFTQGYESKNNKVVEGVYIVPEKFNEDKFDFPPNVIKLIYHKLGKDKEFCSVDLILAYKNGKVVTHEERLPDEIANEIINMMTNEDFRNGTTIDFVESYTPVMKPDRTN